MSGMGLPPPPDMPSQDMPGGSQEPRSRRGSPVAVRPLNLDEVLDGAFKLFIADWRTLVLVTGIFVVPMQLAAYLQHIVGGQSWAYTYLTMVRFFNGVIIIPLATGAAVAAVAATYRGGQSSVGAALRTALGRWWALIASWVLILASVWPFLTGIALFSFGSIDFFRDPQTAKTGALLMIAGIVGLPVVPLCAGTAPAIVVEGLGPLQGMGRSARLLRPRFLPVLGTLVVAGLVILPLSVALGTVPKLVGSAIGKPYGGVFVAGGSIVTGLVAIPLLASVVTLLYFDGRVRSEGLDAALAASSDAREAFAVFYRRHGNEVLRALAVTLDDQELARDATHEAMARAWRSWSQVQDFANPSGWVYRVGLNWARSRLRRVSREVLGIFRDRAVAAADPPDPALARAVQGLSKRHRAVVVLRLYLDWPVADVAAALNVPEGTVRSRQHTAMKQLRTTLEADQ